MKLILFERWKENCNDADPCRFNRFVLKKIKMSLMGYDYAVDWPFEI